MPESGQDGSLDSLEGFRATTLVYFGVDRGLLEVLRALGGENNLLVVEEDTSKMLSLLAEIDDPGVFNPESIEWIFSEGMLSNVESMRFFLGRTAVLNPKSAKRSGLTLAVMRYLKDQTLELNRRRSECDDTYFVMVTYNRLTLTKLTLERLAKNTKPPIRLVIVDNGSTDGTREWLRSSRGKYPFIEKLFFFDENLGIGRALNNGMLYALSRSTKTGRIDNDVLVPPNWLEDLTQVLQSELRPLVVGGFVTDDDTAKEQAENARTERVDDLKVYFVDYAGGCLNLYPKDVFERLGFFPEFPLYGVEDGGLCKAARDAGENVVVVDNVKVEHLPSLFGEEIDYTDFKQEQLRIHAQATKETQGRISMDESVSPST
ncbi:MAG: glycosyltransferase family 2 protein [Deltaproteobacteria bacterium]|nr:glycosyltransferase family 2 protein [Deltaproteobacteria bacterium]